MARQIFIDLETHVRRGPTAAASVLGMSKAGYMHQRGGARPLQPYTEAHIRALLKLTPAQVDALLEERARA